MAIQYKRILLKVSGEALSGPKGTGFDEETIASICAGIKAAQMEAMVSSSKPVPLGPDRASPLTFRRIRLY